MTVDDWHEMSEEVIAHLESGRLAIDQGQASSTRNELLQKAAEHASEFVAAVEMAVGLAECEEE